MKYFFSFLLIGIGLLLPKISEASVIASSSGNPTVTAGASSSGWVQTLGTGLTEDILVSIQIDSYEGEQGNNTILVEECTDGSYGTCITADTSEYFNLVSDTNFTQPSRAIFTGGYVIDSTKYYRFTVQVVGSIRLQCNTGFSSGSGANCGAADDYYFIAYGATGGVITESSSEPNKENFLMYLVYLFDLAIVGTTGYGTFKIIS